MLPLSLRQSLLHQYGWRMGKTVSLFLLWLCGLVHHEGRALLFFIFWLTHGLFFRECVCLVCHAKWMGVCLFSGKLKGRGEFKRAKEKVIMTKRLFQKTVRLRTVATCMCDTSFKAPQNLFSPFFAPSQKTRSFGAGRICGNSWLWRYIGSFFIWGYSALPRESDNGRSRRNGRLLHFYRNGKEGYVALAGQKQARLEKQDADLATSGPPQQSAFNAIFPWYNLLLMTRNLHFFALLTRPDFFCFFEEVFTPFYFELEGAISAGLSGGRGKREEQGRWSLFTYSFENWKKRKEKGISNGSGPMSW